ncbi:MAG: hypothetical protein QXJ75_04885 [Candidatus Bathyarchaeia archaeon]
MDEGREEKLLKIRERIRGRISELEQEIDQLKELLGLVEEYASSKVALAAEAPKPTPTVPLPQTSPPITEQAPPTYEQITPLKAADGTLLGSLFLGKNEMKVTPAENMKFRVSTPPFQQFLISKVLNAMAAKDREEAVQGVIKPEDILSYRIHQDGDTLRELVIRNLGDEQRIVTLRNSIRWTLEKMWEKMKLRS